MKQIIFRLRVFLANKLVKLANKIRPKTVSQFIQSLQDSLIYGSGVTRISPEDLYPQGNFDHIKKDL